MIPQVIPNWIDGNELPASQFFQKISPASGLPLCSVARSQRSEVEAAVEAARKAWPAWSNTPAVQRGMILHQIVVLMQQRIDDIAAIVAAETGKSLKEAKGETQGAIQLGLFYASEGQRLYGQTCTSGAANKTAMTVRRSLGVAGLIIAANTPIANVAWKVFPALICGNAAVLKSSEDSPATAWIFGQIAKQAGLPDGVLNIIHGIGSEAGAALVEHPKVDVISFTGSTAVGRIIQRVAGERFARVSLELGGKNPLIVCDDADLENAAKWILLSAFSNAGQRCAAASRIIIFDEVYDALRKLLVEKTSRLKVGPTDGDDLGPVINSKQLHNMLDVVNDAQKNGATILTGGKRLDDPTHASGFYMAPTIIENVSPDSRLARQELFGPVVALFRAKNFEEAVALANDCDYGLTSCIHTRNIHRAMTFAERIRAGVAVFNAGTFGSEPHMPFGGFKQSGNGTREPGTQALDVYSELQDIYIINDPSAL